MWAASWVPICPRDPPARAHTFRSHTLVSTSKFSAQSKLWWSFVHWLLSSRGGCRGQRCSWWGTWGTPGTLSMTVEDMEALACRSAVVLTSELGLSEVVFEGNSETITKDLNSALPCLSSFGHIIDDVKTLALNFASASFVHTFGKTAKCIPCPHFWSDDLPCNLKQLVTDESISVD